MTRCRAISGSLIAACFYFTIVQYLIRMLHEPSLWLEINLSNTRSECSKKKSDFNPGWDQNTITLDSFADISELRRDIKCKRIKLPAKRDESGSGQARFVIVDPDGNTILIDQHV